jgi:hypothetical protein
VAGDEDEETVRNRARAREKRPEPRALAKGSDSFGRTMPPGVAEAVARLQRDKDEDDAAAGTLTFGSIQLRIEHHGRDVVLVLPDGTRTTGTPEQARDLAKLLLGPMRRVTRE